MASPFREETEAHLPHADQYDWKGFIALGVGFIALGAGAILHIRVAAMIACATTNPPKRYSPNHSGASPTHASPVSPMKPSTWPAFTCDECRTAGA